MGNVRKSSLSSSRIPADAMVPINRLGVVLTDHEPAPKRFRPDADPAVVEAAFQPDISAPMVTLSSLPVVELLPERPGAKNLERYRLKAPAGLPAANTAGLRIFKGRLYADVAPGEVVQVQQNGATGEYRAMLMLERVASGPALFLDPRSGSWRLEHPRSLIASDDAVDIDIDELIRDARNGHAGQDRVRTGRGDWIEVENILENLHVVRGLKQFAPDQAAVIRSELREVESVFADAALALSLNYKEAGAVYESFFGIDYRTVASRFADSVARGLALSGEYQGVWGEEKIFGVDTDSNNAAWMYKTDFHGRLFLNRAFLQRGMLSMSLGHEMLHTSRIDRFKTVGPGAADYFYLEDSRRGLLGLQSQGLYDVPERSVSEVIMRGGLTVGYLKVFTDNHDDFLFGISDYLGIGDDLDLQTAVDIFNTNASLRAHLAANNADSLVFAAKSMQALHRQNGSRD